MIDRGVYENGGHNCQYFQLIGQMLRTVEKQNIFHQYSISRTEQKAFYNSTF